MGRRGGGADEEGMNRLLSFAALVATASALTLAGFAAPASAAGGSYVFDGGTPAQRTTVRNALRASLFPWSILPGTITIHIADGSDSYARPGEIWLDGDLLRSGRFAWGVVQHEYAHQVDFLLFDSAERDRLLGELGGSAWSSFGAAGLAHDQLGAERFASTLAWAYWVSPDNSMAPAAVGDESGAVAPARFRALLSELLGLPQPVVLRTIAKR